MKRAGDGYRAPSHHSTTPALQNSVPSYPHVVFFEVLEALHEIHGEARGDGAVDHAMVIGEADWQHQPRFDLIVANDGLHRPAAETEDSHLWLVEIGRA